MRQRGEDVFFLTGTDEHGEPVAQAAEREGVTPRELADRNAERFKRAHAAAGDLQRLLHPHHRSRAPRSASRRSSSASTTTGTSTPGTYEGWYCPRCADFKTEAEIGPGNTCPIHEHPARVGEGGQLLLPALDLPGAAGAPLCRAPRLRAAVRPLQRGARRSSSRASRTSRSAAPSSPGACRPVGRVARLLRLVRRAAQLRHRARLRAPGGGPDRPLLAGDLPGHRQGHPEVPRGLLAGAAHGGRPRGAAPRADPRLPAEPAAARRGRRAGGGRRRGQPRRRGAGEDVQVARERHRPVRGDRAVRGGRAALLPLPRGPLRPGRAGLHGRLRDALRDRAGQRVRQPRQPLAGDDRALPRRRRARRGGGSRPGRRLRGAGRRGLPAARRRPDHRGAGRDLAAGAPPEPLRGGARALAAGQGPRGGGELDRTLYGLAEGIRVLTVLLHPYLPATSERLLAALGGPSSTWRAPGSGRGRAAGGCRAPARCSPRRDRQPHAPGLVRGPGRRAGGRRRARGRAPDAHRRHGRRLEPQRPGGGGGPPPGLRRRRSPSQPGHRLRRRRPRRAARAGRPRALPRRSARPGWTTTGTAPPARIRSAPSTPRSRSRGRRASRW